MRSAAKEVHGDVGECVDNANSRCDELSSLISIIICQAISTREKGEPVSPSILLFLSVNGPQGEICVSCKKVVIAKYTLVPC